jgi:hypothetical protein
MKAFVVTIDGRTPQLCSSREECEKWFDGDFDDAQIFEVEVPKELHLLLRAEEEVEGDHRFRFSDES